MDDDGKVHSYTFTVPRKEGYLYLSAETYFSKISPYSCSNDVVPLVTINVFRNGDLIKKRHYYDQYPRPIMLKDQGAADFLVKVHYKWNRYSVKDYAVIVYTN